MSSSVSDQNETPLSLSSEELTENKSIPDSGISSSAEVYGNLIELVRDIYAGLLNRPIQLPDFDGICEEIDRLLEELESHPSSMISLFWRTTPDNSLISHTANVLILSLLICKNLGYPKETCTAVGLGAFLHDAGMAAVRLSEDQANQEPSEDENHLKIQARKSYETLKDFLKTLSPESEKIIRNIILQSHEVVSRGHYTDKLKESRTSQEAQIIGLCDTYEILTHPSPYRKKMLPGEALKNIAELSGTTFQSKLVNILWENLTSYPPGSFVHLSSGETAQVIDLGKNKTSSPIVRVIISKKGEKVKGKKIIDLGQSPKITIEKAVGESDIKPCEVSIRLKLRAQEWWFGSY